MKKIRFVNPIKECVSIQGKPYTATLIVSIAAAFVLSIVSAILKMPIYSVISGILGIGTLGYFSWWFGTQRYTNSSLEEEV